VPDFGEVETPLRAGRMAHNRNGRSQ
jgi:hypothetical protein